MTISLSTNVSRKDADTTVAFQTQHEAISYAATAVESVSFTHDSVQDVSPTNPINPNIHVSTINIVRQYLGDGEAYVKISGSFTQSSGTSQDAPVVITLPEGTLNKPFLSLARALRLELNKSSYVLIGVSADALTIDRDDDINEDSPAYFEVEGIGNWVGARPSGIVLARTVTAHGLYEDDMAAKAAGVDIGDVYLSAATGLGRTRMA